eukprot:150130-Prymnesium_polylepis.3
MKAPSACFGVSGHCLCGCERCLLMWGGARAVLSAVGVAKRERGHTAHGHQEHMRSRGLGERGTRGISYQIVVKSEVNVRACPCLSVLVRASACPPLSV